MSKIDKYLWVEKYRPKTIDKVVLNPEHELSFKKWVSEKEIPNVLFVGCPGSGKTTVARILVETIIDEPESDLLVLNGSTSRGIAIVKEQIEEFLKTIVLGDSKIKIVFIDEFDFMTKDAQAALRNIIEAYSDTGRFILTANHEYKIEDAIKSRMQVFRFRELPRSYIDTYIKNILKVEKINYDAETVEAIVSAHYPDVRKIIGSIQAASHSGKLTKPDDCAAGPEDELINLIGKLAYEIGGVADQNRKDSVKVKCNNVIQEIYKIVGNTDVNYPDLYEKLLKTDIVPIWMKIHATEYYTLNHTAVSQQFNFMAFVYESIKTGLAQCKMQIGFI